MMFCKHCSDRIDKRAIQAYCQSIGISSSIWYEWYNEAYQFSMCLDCGMEVLLGKTPELYIKPQFGGGRYGPLHEQSPWQEFAVRIVED